MQNQCQFQQPIALKSALISVIDIDFDIAIAIATKTYSHYFVVVISNSTNSEF